MTIRDGGHEVGGANQRQSGRESADDGRDRALRAGGQKGTVDGALFPSATGNDDVRSLQVGGRVDRAAAPQRGPSRTTPTSRSRNSAFCTFAPSLHGLVAARALQGLGGAAILALGVPLLRFSVPPQRLGAAIGWNALTVALASSAGPGVGALILAHAHWPWLYAVNIPLGLAVLAASRQLPRTPAGPHRLDIASMALSGAMFASLFIGAQLFLTRPLLALGLAVAGVVCLGLLVRRESPKAAPLIPLDLLRQPSLRLSVPARPGDRRRARSPGRIGQSFAGQGSPSCNRKPG